MNQKNFFKNIAQVAVSNGFRLLSSILMGLILPIVFSVENYGYYRLFSLYLTYVGLFHLGFIDGVYLHFGGKSYSELEKPKFVLYTRFLFYLELFATVVILFISLLFLDGERQIVFILLAVNLIATNLTTYYQFILQITSRFKEFSLLNTVYAVISSILVGIIFLLKLDNYKIFLLMILFINYGLLLWFIFKYREITFGNKAPTKSVKGDVIQFFKLGTPLLVANLITVLMLNLPKQLVDWFYNIETFAIFTFAYSLMSLANIFVVAMSTVIYPTLKKIDESRLKNLYNHSISLVLIVVMFAMALYFPLYLFVDKIIPKYSASLNILRIIFPGLVVSSAIQIVKLNYFKVLQHIKQYFLTGFTSLFISAIIGYLAYVMFGTTESIAISSVIAIFIWYVLTEIYFLKIYKINPTKNLVYIILGISTFYIPFFISSIYIGFVLYVLVIFVLTFILYKNLIIKVVKSKGLE